MIGGVKHARSLRTSGAKPDVALTMGGDASAGGECGFRLQDFRQAGQHLPMIAAIMRLQHGKMVSDRVADGNAVIAIPKGKAVKEVFWIEGNELLLPRLAAICCLENSRLGARTRRHRVSNVGIERLYITEV